MGNGAFESWNVPTNMFVHPSFNTLWEMEPCRKSRSSSGDSCFNTLWEMEPKKQWQRYFLGTAVSIPYGKWSPVIKVDTTGIAGVSIPYGKWSPYRCGRTSIINMFQYPMGNGAIGGTYVKKVNRSVSIPYGKWSLASWIIKYRDKLVSIPYGKWSQQQLVVEAIIAYKPLHVKGFPQKGTEINF